MRKVGRSQRRLSFVVSGLETMPVFFFFFFFSPIPSLCLASPRRHRRRRRRSVGPIICLMAVSRTNRSHRQKRGGGYVWPPGGTDTSGRGQRIDERKSLERNPATPPFTVIVVITKVCAKSSSRWKITMGLRI